MGLRGQSSIENGDVETLDQVLNQMNTKRRVVTEQILIKIVLNQMNTNFNANKTHRIYMLSSI